SATTDVAQSTLTIVNLLGNTTYYFRVAGINWNNIITYGTIGSTLTASAPPGNPLIAAVNVSSITVAWTGLVNANNTGYQADAATASNFSGTIISSVTSLQLS